MAHYHPIHELYNYDFHESASIKYFFLENEANRCYPCNLIALSNMHAWIRLTKPDIPIRGYEWR